MGSNPIARSRLLRNRPADRQAISRNCAATWPSGKAEVCKTSITGSNPVVASFNTISALELPSSEHARTDPERQNTS